MFVPKLKVTCLEEQYSMCIRLGCPVSWRSMISGVPQECVLGLPLLLLFFKDISASNDAQSVLFADYTLLSEGLLRKQRHSMLSTHLISPPFRVGSTTTTCSTVAASQPGCSLIHPLDLQLNSPRYTSRSRILRAYPTTPNLVSDLCFDDRVWSRRLLVSCMFTSAEFLLSATTSMEWPFCRFFLAFIRPRIEYAVCNVV